MTSDHPINRTLLTLLENQVRRTEAALEDLDESIFDRTPGGDCKTICQIGQHLVMLRRFQLSLLQSPLVDRIPDPDSISSLGQLRSALAEAAGALHEAITEHDPEDWYARPDTPREGLWGDEPTLHRLSRPFNDFVNHLGAIRAIRRILGNGAERTQ
jgi:hypothetical protein